MPASSITVRYLRINNNDRIGPSAMRFPFIFGLLGAILTALAAHQARQATGVGWLVVAVEAEAAICLFALSALYGLRSAGICVEDVSRRPGWATAIRVIILPNLLLGRFSLHVGRWFDREGLLNPLAPGLFIGRFPFPSERDGLRAAGIDAVLNLCWEFPGLSGSRRGPRFETGRVPILDGAAPSDRQFDDAVRWVAARRDEGRCVLIHCAQGHGRTSTVAAAVLVRLGLAPDAGQALATIRAARPFARPSRGQEAALIRYLSAPTTGSVDRGPKGDLIDSEAH